MPDKVKELHAMMITWRKEVGAKMPTSNQQSAGEWNEGKE